MPAWAAAVLAAASAQGDEKAFTFSVQEGWSLSVRAERELFQVSEKDLAQGLEPRFYLPQADPRTFLPPTPARAPRPVPGGASPAFAYRRSREQPLRIEGTLVLGPGGAVRLALRRIHYVDTTQAWRIELGEEKVQTAGLGGSSAWRGSRDDWARRLDTLERAAVDAYVRALSPASPDAVKAGFGLGLPTADDPGRRLQVLLCLEEQLSLLLLARLDGERLEGDLWPAICARYPPRAIGEARRRVLRLAAQARSELAPPDARRAPSRAVKGRPLEGPLLALPAPDFEPGADWAAERLRPVAEARRRLAQLALDSQRGLGIEEAEWRRRVRQESAALQETLRMPPLPKTPDLLHRLPAPRRLESGPGVYDYREKQVRKDGETVSSEVDCSGALEADVAFFVAGPDVWKAARVRLEPWYAAELQRKP